MLSLRPAIITAVPSPVSGRIHLSTILLLVLPCSSAAYWLAIPALAIAGSLVQKKKVPVTRGTLPTHTPLFIFWLIAVVIIVGALSFLPALSLGPIVEHLMMR